MLQTIRRNFGLKILSVALAIVGWSYFRFAGNPAVAPRSDQQLSVPIAVINLPVGYVAHSTEKEALVTVLVNRGQAPIKPDDIKAVVDLSKVNLPGVTAVYNVPVQLISPNVAVQSLSPASLTLSVEKIVQRAFPVTVHYPRLPDTVVGAAIIAPTAALVRGPASSMGEVVALQLNLASTARGNVDVMIRPVPVDAKGEEVAGLQVAPNLVRLQAHVGAKSAGSGTR